MKNGMAPLGYSTGVVDTSSFWSAYGSGVSSNLGGSAVVDSVQASGQAATASKADQNREMVKKLFGQHDLAEKVNAALLPQLANVWGVSYEEGSVISLEKPALTDPRTGVLSSFDSQVDLILMTQVENLNLTERFSVGGAFASGLTMGTNKKSLTTETRVALRAFKRDLEAGGYKQVWFQMCGPDYTTMKTSYYLDELVESQSKMTEILDEATAQSIALCTKALDSINSANLAARNR